MSDIEIYSLPETTQLLCAKTLAAVAAVSGESRILHDGDVGLFWCFRLTSLPAFETFHFSQFLYIIKNSLQ